MALPVDKEKWILQLVMLEDRVVSVSVSSIPMDPRTLVDQNGS